MQQMIDKLEKNYITPQRKRSFLCCAECCDRARDSQALQQWYVLPVGEKMICGTPVIDRYRVLQHGCTA